MMACVKLWTLVLFVLLPTTEAALTSNQLLAVEKRLAGSSDKKSSSKDNAIKRSRKRRIPVIGNTTDDEPPLPRMIKDPAFGYSILNSRLCNRHTNVFVWVHSAPNQFRKRLTLRETWANPHSFPSGYNVKVGFFLGLISGKSKRNVTEGIQKLQFESELYQDIIQEKYIDHYHNMSYKAISALRWITKFCPQAKLIIKSDDDTLIDLPLLLRHIHNLQSHNMMLNNTVICK